MLHWQFCMIICFLLSQTLCIFYKDAFVNARDYHSSVFVVFFATTITVSVSTLFVGVGKASGLYKM